MIGPSRHSPLVVLGMTVVLLTPSAAGWDSSAAKNQDRSEASNDSAAGSPNTAPRLREGLKIVDQLGEFQKADDGVNFHSKNGQRVLHVLENLALERIARLLEDDPAPRVWCISGVVTEFRGENYLLISRAIVKPRANLGASSSGETKEPTR